MRALDSRRPVGRFVNAAVLATALLWTSSAAAVPRTFVINPDYLFVTFMVEHAGLAKIVGRFMRGKGRFVYDPAAQQIVSGTLTVFSKSVFTGHYQRDKVLRSAPLLHVSEYPEITFEIADFEHTGRGAGKLDGQLTMRGETHPVTFDAQVNRVTRATGEEDAPLILGGSARMTIARSRWGMNPGFAQLADGAEIIIEFEAVQKVN